MIHLAKILPAKLLGIKVIKGNFNLVQGIKKGQKSNRSFKNLGHGLGGFSQPAQIHLYATVTNDRGDEEFEIMVKKDFRSHFRRFSQKILDLIEQEVPINFQVEVRQNNRGDYYYAVAPDDFTAWTDRIKQKL